MITALAAVLISSSSDPIALLKEAKQHYASLKRFEATIEHHDDSGLFPGDYTQKLVWTGKGKFDIKVTKPSSYKPTQERPGGLAPDYRADGTTVTSAWADGRTSSDAVTPRENSSPGWEVSGGLAMSFLERTKIVDYLLDPPEQYKLTWSLGKATNWQDMEVRELIAEFGGRDQKMHVYLEKSRPLFVGVRAEGGSKGWMIYRDIKTEPK